MKISNELKTGIFVVVCVVAFGALAIRVGKITWVKKGYLLKTQFHYTGGVKKHAPVCLSGVEVGEVKDIRLLYGQETLVELDLWIREGVNIRLDSSAMASTFGLMGEKYIEIKSGTTSPEYAKEGDAIGSTEPFRMEELVEIGKKVAGDISKTTQDIGLVAKHVDEIVVENRPRINSMMENFYETSSNFRDFSDDVKHHPWKVLLKGKEMSREEMDRERAQRLLAHKKSLAATQLETPELSAAETTIAASSTKQNFIPGKKT